MERNTKQRILDAAFDLFSQKGYSGTSVQDIADMLGLTKPAIYRHYTSKEEIWDCLVDKIEKYYNEKMVESADTPLPESLEHLKNAAYRQIDFTLSDTTVIRVRKLLNIEQYKSPKTAELATKHFVTDIKNIYSRYFSHLMKKGEIIKGDCDMMSLAFVSPVGNLIHLCDRQPELKEKTEKQIKEYVDAFFNGIKLK